MVCEWGMSEKLGPLAFGKKEGEVFLGREIRPVARTTPSRPRSEIDAEVRRIVMEQLRARQEGPRREPSSSSSAIAEALLEYETIDGADIDVLMAGGTINRAAAAQVESAAAAHPRHVEGGAPSGPARHDPGAEDRAGKGLGRGRSSEHGAAPESKDVKVMRSGAGVFDGRGPSSWAW